jgi:hypothetical protein
MSATNTFLWDALMKADARCMWRTDNRGEQLASITRISFWILAGTADIRITTEMFDRRTLKLESWDTWRPAEGVNTGKALDWLGPRDRYPDDKFTSLMPDGPSHLGKPTT